METGVLPGVRDELPNVAVVALGAPLAVSDTALAKTGDGLIVTV